MRLLRLARHTKPGRARRAVAMSLLATVVGVGAAASLRPAQPVSAYNTYGWKWFNPDLIYIGDYGNGVPAYAERAMQAAASGWNAVTAFSLAYENASDYNAQVWFVPYWSNSGSRNGGSWTALGFCQQFDNAGYCIRGEVDINLDPNNQYSSIWRCNCADIESFQIAELGQELGHVFGLAHSCVDWQWMTGPNASCPNGGYYDQCSSNCPGSPQQDDQRGVAALYPKGDSNGSGGSGCAAMASSPPPTLNASIMATVPPVPTPPPHPTATVPPNPYTSNLFYAAGQTRQDHMYPVEQGEATADNEKARANGIWPSGQQVKVPGGPGVTVPSANRPC